MLVTQGTNEIKINLCSRNLKLTDPLQYSNPIVSLSVTDKSICQTLLSEGICTRIFTGTRFCRNGICQKFDQFV